MHRIEKKHKTVTFVKAVLAWVKTTLQLEKHPMREKKWNKEREKEKKKKKKVRNNIILENSSKAKRAHITAITMKQINKIMWKLCELQVIYSIISKWKSQFIEDKSRSQETLKYFNLRHIK